MNGLFIVFEGGEGSGKSSLARLLYEELVKTVDTILVNDPGGTDVGMDIRKILLNPEKKSSITTELYLYHAARAQLVDEIILPALREGKVVISDRFNDSTHVYQGDIRGWDKNTLNNLDDITNKGIKPDITFLCNVSATIGLKRSLKVNKDRVNGDGQDESKWELEGLNTHKKINLAFVNRMLSRSQDGDIIYYLDSNNLTITEMLDIVMEKISRHVMDLS